MWKPQSDIPSLLVRLRRHPRQAAPSSGVVRLADPKRQRIRDPLHNLIEFDEGDPFERMLWRIIRTPEFQRLRRIKQLGFSDLVYPGASHSRFIHSLGVFQTARQLMRIVKRHVADQPGERLKAEAALAAALLHDIGHGPFSHAFEPIGQTLGWKLAGHHENLSEALILNGSIASVLNNYFDGFAGIVSGVIRGGPSNVYRSVVSSQFDADRLDYVRRDRLMSGTQLAGIDFDWLIANLEVGELPSDPDGVKRVTLVLGPKAQHAAEGFVVGLFQMYPTVYFHKTTRCAEKITQELLLAIGKDVADGHPSRAGLPDHHPIISLFRDPENLAVLGELDDAVVAGALAMMSTASNPLIQEFSTRLRHRNLFKAVDLDHLIRQRLPEDKIRAEQLYIRRRENTLKRLEDWMLDKNGCRILLDKAERKPYKKIDDEGPMNQIWIRDGSRLVDLREKSAAVASIDPFRLFRAYVRHDDDEARLIINGAVTEAAREE